MKFREGFFRFSGKFLGIDSALLPNCEWNQKQKHKKTALGQCGMLRIWRCDCALCVIGNEFPCRQQHNPIRHPLTRAIHFAPRIKTARRFTAKNP